MTSIKMLREWFIRGMKEKAAYMLVVCDTFDYEDYPVYVAKGKDPHVAVSEYSKDMQKVMEVYNLSKSWGEQNVVNNRVFDYGKEG